MRRLITKTSTKRVVAAAITDALDRNGWSNVEAGEAFGNCEGTIRNRLDTADDKSQMTVHELRRITDVDGPAVANRIFRDDGYRLSPVEASDGQASAIAVAAGISQANSDLLRALADGVIDQAEARELLPAMEKLCRDIVALKAQLRVIAGEVPA